MRVVVEVKGRINLLQFAFVEHADARPHRHRLDLVMRDVDEGGLKTLMQTADERTRLHPQLRVQVRKRLIHQEDGGLANDRAADRHALALTAGELTGAAIQQVPNAELIRGFVHALVNDLLGRLAQLQAKSHVVVDSHVRIQCVALEDHRDIAIFGRHIVDHAVTNEDLALGDLFQASEHPKARRFAAAGRTDKYEKLFILDLDGQIGYDSLITEIL